jgi:hypothetical protein
MMQSTTPHWPQFQPRHVGVGAVNQGLIDAAQAVVNFFAANACTRASIPEVASFQATYNTSGMPGALTIDGQYGGNTERALQIVLNNTPAAGGGGPVQAVPSNCFAMAVPETPVLDVTPTATPTTPTTTTTTTTTTTPSTMSPWIIGGAAAVVAGGVGYAIYRARKRRRG